MFFIPSKHLGQKLRTITACLLVLGFLQTSLAEGLPLDKPENVGVSSERLQRLSAAMQRYIDGNMLAGTVALISRNGKIIHL